LRAWAAARLVPKVLVASQTAVIEAVVDEAGAWLPSVPVVSVMPRAGVDVWRVGAVLTSPVSSAWLAGRRLGSGLASSAIRVSARDVQGLPLPVDSDRWDAATDRLRAGDVVGCGESMADAYGLDPAQASATLGWWRAKVARSLRRVSTAGED
jgi:hypothetical protein